LAKSEAAIHESLGRSLGIVTAKRYALKVRFNAALVEEELTGSLDLLPEANEFLDKYQCMVV
jgi:hypothetical protein